eukprot:5675582-Amphidinium_carterae.1
MAKYTNNCANRLSHNPQHVSQKTTDHVRGALSLVHTFRGCVGKVFSPCNLVRDHCPEGSAMHANPGYPYRTSLAFSGTKATIRNAP